MLVRPLMWIAEELTSPLVGEAGGAGLRIHVFEEHEEWSMPIPDRGTLIVGRDSACDVVVSDASVSRRHAALRVGDVTSIEDLGSANGTTVDGVRLPTASEVELRPGRVARLGRVHLVLLRSESGHTAGTRIEAVDLALDAQVEPVSSAPSTAKSSSLRRDVEALERSKILAALEWAGGNQTRAAAMLGISRRTLGKRLDQFGMPRPRKRSDGG